MISSILYSCYSHYRDKGNSSSTASFHSQGIVAILGYLLFYNLYRILTKVLNYKFYLFNQPFLDKKFHHFLLCGAFYLLIIIFYWNNNWEDKYQNEEAPNIDFAVVVVLFAVLGTSFLVIIPAIKGS